MPRKIYDIKPPKIAKKTEKAIKEFLAEEKVAVKRTSAYKRQAPAPKKQKEKRRSMWLPVGGVAFVALFCFAAYLFFTLPRADILISPKINMLDFKQVVTLDKSANQIDGVKFIIPAKVFDASKTESQDFPATGSGDNTGLASGTITVYNKSGITYLKAGTHFMSDSGKLFVAPSKIILPLPTKTGGKVTPGTVSVKVQAVDGGDSYNIAPANFSVPGLKGTADYYNIYGVSTVAMSGGYAGKIKKVTDDDIQGANDVLVKKATDESSAALKAEIPSDYVLLDGAISTNTINASTPTKSGAVVDKFTYSATVKASGIAFKKSDLDSFAKNYLQSQVQNGQTVLDSSYKMNYSTGAVDVSGGKAMLNTEYSEGTYRDIDINSIAISLMGKNASQINDQLSNTFGQDISNVKINFWPFWVSSAPNSQKAVKVKLKF